MLEILPIIALVSPFLVWPIEYLLPYPYLVEESIKLVAVYIILNSAAIPWQKVKSALIFGTLFALSETVFYFFNIVPAASFTLLVQRGLLTTVLHSLTTLLILLPGLKSRKFLVLGLLLAILVHYLYNYFVYGPLDNLPLATANLAF